MADGMDGEPGGYSVQAAYDSARQRRWLRQRLMLHSAVTLVLCLVLACGVVLLDVRERLAPYAPFLRDAAEAGPSPVEQLIEASPIDEGAVGFLQAALAEMVLETEAIRSDLGALVTETADVRAQLAALEGKAAERDRGVESARSDLQAAVQEYLVATDQHVAALQADLTLLSARIEDVALETDAVRVASERKAAQPAAPAEPKAKLVTAKRDTHIVSPYFVLVISSNQNGSLTMAALRTAKKAGYRATYYQQDHGFDSSRILVSGPEPEGKAAEVARLLKPVFGDRVLPVERHSLPGERRPSNYKQFEQYGILVCVAE